MDTLNIARLTLRRSEDRRTLDGAWWPRSRDLAEELPALFAVWPSKAGYITRAVVAARDWDSTPSKVSIPLRRGQVKTDLLPADTTHHAVLIMLEGASYSLVVIPPTTSPETAAQYLDSFGELRTPEAAQ